MGSTSNEKTRNAKTNRAVLAATIVMGAVAGTRSAQLALPAALGDARVHRAVQSGWHLSLEGPGWPAMSGTWTMNGDGVTLQNQAGPEACAQPGRYTLTIDGTRVSFALVADTCEPRRMIMDRSQWIPAGLVPPPPVRTIGHTGGPAKKALAPAGHFAGTWPSFRGPEASGSADGQHLPDRWSPTTGENILWRTPIPGLAHSSPITWGDLVFVTSAISSRGHATFKPGLYGDGDASDDRSSHRWILHAIDKRTGRIRWTRTAAEGEPRNKRHIKSTYASASPATDGRISSVVFGSQASSRTTSMAACAGP